MYSQNWDLLYEFACDQHEAKIREAARYRLLKMLKHQTAKPAQRGSRPHWWKPWRPQHAGLTSMFSGRG